MSDKELLIKEIESLPSELLTEVLDFIRFIKISHTKKQSKTDINSSSNSVQLRNQVYRYDDPTEPIALEDWEFLH